MVRIETADNTLFMASFFADQRRWFTARRGLVIGVLTGAAAAGQLIFLPTFAAVTTHFGWRTTVLIVAAVALVVIPLVALLMRERPQDDVPLGRGEPGQQGQPDPGSDQ